MGGDTQARSFDVLKRGGTLIATSQPPSQEEAGRRGVRATMVQMQASGAGLRAIGALLDAGTIKTFVGQTFPLAQAAEAWKVSIAGHAVGKIVLEVPR